ncbi:MAG: hypothetical protein ACSHYB_03950 [Roseibacillus sp.]
MKVLFLSLLWIGYVSAVTKEVVQVFQPVSYHDTDSAMEFGVKGELIQAAVVERAVVLSGAFPEDLVKAVGMPFRFETNNPTYDVKEANLVVLCGLAIEVTREEKSIEVVIDCSKFAIPELVELTDKQILTMTIEAIRRTARVYYQAGAYEAFKCHLRLVGLGEDRKELQSLDSKFQVGPSRESESNESD